MLQTSTSLMKFAVRRHAPELIAPALPTPLELKPLSDIDNQEDLRYIVPAIKIYKSDPKMENINPASVIRDALSKVLVLYYPLAGRLKEGPTKKLMVDCTGEGVLFIEAEADVTVKQFGDVLHPPFPCLEELVYDVPGFGGIIDSPLLLIQVTRLLCGGFIFATRLRHTICDGIGFAQFLTALGEMARGAPAPSTSPVWQRELLLARNPPRVTFNHHEYDEMANTKGPIMRMDNMIRKSFFFGSTELSAIRRFVPDNLKASSTFEMLAACLWRCRTIALEPDLEEEMRFIFPVNARTMFNPSLPLGYYGNCFVEPCAISTAHDLIDKPLGHAIELVMKARSLVSEEYVRSVADLMVMKARPRCNLAWPAFAISNLSRIGFLEIDFGWGKAAYAGPTTGVDFPHGVLSYYIAAINEKGESAIMIIMSLPSASMDKFVKELNNVLM